jgi:hypothetical protein
MTRYIKIKEKDYAKGRRAIKRLREIKPEVEALHKIVWVIKNKMKNQRRKVVK